MTTHLSATVLNALVDGELSRRTVRCNQRASRPVPLVHLERAESGIAENCHRKSWPEIYPAPSVAGTAAARCIVTGSRSALASHATMFRTTLSIRRIASLALPIAAVLLVLASASLLIAAVCEELRARLRRASCAGHGNIGSAYRHACVRSAARGDLLGSSYREAVVPGKTSLQLQSSGQSAGRYTAGWRQSHVSPQSCGGAAALQHRPPSRLCIHPGTIGVGSTKIRLRRSTSGFHVTGFDTSDLEVTAISDVDPSRLSGLVRAIEEAQMKRLTQGCDSSPIAAFRDNQRDVVVLLLRAEALHISNDRHDRRRAQVAHGAASTLRSDAALRTPLPHRRTIPLRRRYRAPAYRRA